MPNSQNNNNKISSLAEMMQMFRAFQPSRIMLTAYETDVFTVIDNQPLSSEDIAKKIGADKRAIERLMNAVTALGYAIKADDLYSNTELTSKFLVKGKATYLGGISHTNNLWNTWSKLTETVRTGTSPMGTHINDRDPNWLRYFINAMHSRGRALALEIAKMIDFSGIYKILDVGGGSGIFASTFVRQNENMNAVVFDLPNVIPITQEFIEKENLQGRVTCSMGDYLKDDIGSGFDLIYLSAVIHSNSENENKLLIKKCFDALNAGGKIVIIDFAMNEERTEPLGGTIFAINMLVGTERGDTFKKNEIYSWLTEASFVDLEIQDVYEGNSLIIARKL